MALKITTYLFVVFCGLGILLISGAELSFAQEAEESESHNEMMDSFHSEGTSTLFALTDDIDRFFGDIRTEEYKRNDSFRLGVEVKLRKDSATRFRERLRADLDLKEYAKNLRFFISGDSGNRFDNNRLLGDISQGTDFRSDYGGDTGATGVSRDYYKTPFTLIGGDLGIKFGPLRPFTQFRASHWFPLTKKLSFEPTQYIQWISKDGAGLRTRFDLNYQLTKRSRLRARTEALRSESSSGWEVFEDLSWYKKLTHRTYAGFATSVYAYTDPSWTAERYQISMRLREQIYGNWLYLELEPGLEFPHERDYETTPYVAVRLDAYFVRKQQATLTKD